jgi:bifunctional non-homologous end joining protein LigD
VKINPLAAGFVVPAQPVKDSKPPVGADWVHEIKHDGYRIIARRDGPTVRLYGRNAYDWTVRLAAIANAAECIKAESFTIDGEAGVLGPDGLSRLEELSRKEAVLTAVEHDGEALLPVGRARAAAERTSTGRGDGGRLRETGAKTPRMVHDPG